MTEKQTMPDNIFICKASGEVLLICPANMCNENEQYHHNRVVEALKARISVLEGALEFYENQENYIVQEESLKNISRPLGLKLGATQWINVLVDHGRKARAALKGEK